MPDGEDHPSKRETLLANAEERIEEHPVATAAAVGLGAYLLVRLGRKRREE